MYNKIKTGVDNFDDILGGGLYEGSSMVLRGSPGTGKTTLGMQFVYNGIVKYNESGLIVTFEEFPQKLYRDALSYGWDLRRLEEENKLKVVFTTPEIFVKDLKRGGLITKLVAEIKLRRVLIDTAACFNQLATSAVELRSIYNKVLHSLEKDNITTVFTSEVEELIGDTKIFNHSLSYVVDVVVLLRYVEIEGEMRRAVLVLKTRGSKHEEAIREYQISSKGIVLKDKFEKIEGILSGTTRKVISDRIEKFFVQKNK